MTAALVTPLRAPALTAAAIVTAALITARLTKKAFLTAAIAVPATVPRGVRR